MDNLIKTITQNQIKKNIPEIRSGYTIRVHQKIQEGGKERIQSFEGIVIALKHGKGINATITVRRIASNVGVERIFPIHSPSIALIEVIKKARTRRAKLYYLRKNQTKKAAKMRGEEYVVKKERKINLKDVQKKEKQEKKIKKDKDQKEKEKKQLEPKKEADNKKQSQEKKNESEKEEK